MVMTYDAFGELISICQKNVLFTDFANLEPRNDECLFDEQNRQYSINNI